MLIYATIFMSSCKKILLQEINKKKNFFAILLII